MRNESEAARVRLLTEAEAYRDEKLKAAAADAATFTARLEQFRRVAATNPDALTVLWREEIGRVLAGVKQRGRIEVLDDVLGPNGIELNQFLPTKRP